MSSTEETVPADRDTELRRWNERFGSPDYVFGTRPNAFLVSQRERLVPGMQALAVADGEGRNSAWLAAQGLDVTAFDFSPVAVDKARRLAQQQGVQVDYRVERLEHWVWEPERYDLVAAIFVQFATPPQRQAMFDGMVRTLRPGGLLMLQGYRPEQLGYATGGPKQVDQLYTETLLRESFRSLEILHLAAYDAVLDEGAGHRGMSALIDLVARKA